MNLNKSVYMLTVVPHFDVNYLVSILSVCFSFYGK